MVGRIVKITGRWVKVSTSPEPFAGGGITRKTWPDPAAELPTPVLGEGLGPNGSCAGWKVAVVVGRTAEVLGPPFAANADGATPSAEAIAMHPNKRVVVFIRVSPVVSWSALRTRIQIQ